MGCNMFFSLILTTKCISDLAGIEVLSNSEVCTLVILHLCIHKVQSFYLWKACNINMQKHQNEVQKQWWINHTQHSLLGAIHSLIFFPLVLLACHKPPCPQFLAYAAPSSQQPLGLSLTPYGLLSMLGMCDDSAHYAAKSSGNRNIVLPCFLFSASSLQVLFIYFALILS